MREAALDQHGIVAQLVRNLVAHDRYCRADAHADRLRETRAYSHTVLWTVKKRIRENAHSQSSFLKIKHTSKFVNGVAEQNYPSAGSHFPHVDACQAAGRLVSIQLFFRWPSCGDCGFFDYKWSFLKTKFAVWLFCVVLHLKNSPSTRSGIVVWWLWSLCEC